MSVYFTFDRNAFAALTFKEADDQINDYSKLSWKERLVFANRLIANAYNFPLDNPPRMDKTIFSSRKQHG